MSAWAVIVGCALIAIAVYAGLCQAALIMGSLIAPVEEVEPPKRHLRLVEPGEEI